MQRHMGGALGAGAQSQSGDAEGAKACVCVCNVRLGLQSLNELVGGRGTWTYSSCLDGWAWAPGARCTAGPWPWQHARKEAAGLQAGRTRKRAPRCTPRRNAPGRELRRPVALVRLPGVPRLHTARSSKQGSSCCAACHAHASWSSWGERGALLLLLGGAGAAARGVTACRCCSTQAAAAATQAGRGRPGPQRLPPRNRHRNSPARSICTTHPSPSTADSVKVIWAGCSDGVEGVACACAARDKVALMGPPTRVCIALADPPPHTRHQPWP